MLILLALLLYLPGYGQKNPYNLPLVNTRQAYLQSVAADSNNRFVEIKRFIPTVKLDIRYATKNNFTGQVMYPEARAFARLPVALALRSVQAELRKEGLGLKIFDAYRPYDITLKFFEVASDKSFVADPKKGSRHNRGCAIDLTLINQKTGKELAMPTPYDSFSPMASPTYADLPENVRANRDLLIAVMKRHGFAVIENEWWHFDFKGWNKFALTDVAFSDLR
jgi:zinc D-Ala-D-Ala dipeptidase